MLRRQTAQAVSIVRNSPYLKHSAVFFVGSLLVSLLNYLYYPILGRVMTTAQFGEVQALVSLFLQTSIFLSILSYVTVHITVNVKDPDSRNRTLLGLERYASIAGIAILAIMLAAVRFLQHFLKFEHAWPFIMLILGLALSIPLAFRMAFLRGRKQFGKASFSDGIGSFAKLIFSPALVAVGMGTTGAILGLSLSQIVSIVFVYIWARRYGFSGHGLRHKGISLRQLKPQFIYAGAILVLSSGITALLSTDILAAKHYFSPETAGLYAGMATIARIVYYMTVPITGVMISHISTLQPAAKNRLQLRASSLLITGIGLAGLAVMAAAPQLIIRLLVGARYLAFSGLLVRLVIALLILSLANLFLLYHVSLNRYRFIFVPIVGFFITISFIYWYHASVQSIVNGILLGSSVTLALIPLFWTLNRKPDNTIQT